MAPSGFCELLAADVEAECAPLTGADDVPVSRGARRPWRLAFGLGAVVGSAAAAVIASRSGHRWSSVATSGASVVELVEEITDTEQQEESTATKWPIKPNNFSGMAGKTVYFAPVDRFAKDAGAPTKECTFQNTWCNGTLRGLTRELPYIQAMGFDCVWITPVVLQWPGEDPSGTGCMGYWAQNLYEIDPHFGTKQDLKDLIAGLHERGMCLIYDFVANHMGPIHNADMALKKYPFNKTEYYHQLFIGNMTFDEYTEKEEKWPPPAQAMWSQSGAQCTKGVSCACYVCSVPQKNPFAPCDDGERVFDPDSPCPRGALSPYCMPGDYACKGYNQTITHEGWFFDLGDLNQSNPDVWRMELEWIHWFVNEYGIDNLRLDTAPFMTFEFLSEVQAAAGVPIIGEVTATNLTFHANFQRNPPVEGGQDVLAGVLNFPIYYTALSAFCGTFFPFSTFNMTFLGERMQQQLDAPYKDLDNLGNFIDNHDVERVAKACNADVARIKSSLVWVMMSKGIPIIYYGTEFLFQIPRESMWQTGYAPRTEITMLLTRMNHLRKKWDIGVSDATMLLTQNTTHLAFMRWGNVPVLVLLNNLPSANQTQSTEYCFEAWPKEFPDNVSGHSHFDFLHRDRDPVTFDHERGCVTTPTSEPALVPLHT